MMQMISTSIGWLGVFLCTAGYFLLSTKKISAESRSFQLLNIAGGLCLVTAAVYSNDLPNAVANLLWASIGLYSLRQGLKSKNINKPDQGAQPRNS
ncbi:CBU_0592 family membrane protein [Pedobacter nutrimenti]|jgi:hypothetical protein|uniref:CBU-0592-like domain-containing protein n=1 Tax=Pedobacter nutrimenti TaxID=1241337 RepID=A0A318UCM0_9SPHI|nr:hypothetical protein [Pedobacter nutrimenti]PYF74124.1 hypothetical protein B0O44_104295 [Pedobacter nutrimenti]